MYAGLDVTVWEGPGATTPNTWQLFLKPRRKNKTSLAWNPNLDVYWAALVVLSSVVSHF